MQRSATIKIKSKRSIFNEPLSQKCSTDKNKLRSTKVYESEFANKKHKDANNEVACDVKNYFNVYNKFECVRNNPDVSCERACISTGYNEYFTGVLDTI